MLGNIYLVLMVLAELPEEGVQIIHKQSLMNILLLDDLLKQHRRLFQISIMLRWLLGSGRGRQAIVILLLI